MLKLFRVLPRLFFLLLLAVSCSKKNTPPDTVTAEDEARGQPAPAPAWPLLASLQTGENPLWFELGPEGPLLIETPAAASLTAFAPWPHARFVAGMEAWNSSLVMAANRGGFLVIEPKGEQGGAALYSAADPARWDPYTVGAFFFHEDAPAVLLYRDDFFVSAPASMPEYQVLVLREDYPLAARVRAPALEVLPKGEGWEVNSLRRGPDGRWYYRFVQTGYPRPGTAYYRAADLSREGESISLEEYRNSSAPENASAGPPFVAPLLAALGERFPESKGVPLLRMICPEFSGTRLFSVRPDAGEEFVPFFGYSGSLGAGQDAAVMGFALTPNGKGIAFGDDVFFDFSLPPLPEGFVYTSAGLAGNILVASWEEQKDSLVGAAGFMALNAKSSALLENR